MAKLLFDATELEKFLVLSTKVGNLWLTIEL